MKERKYEDIVKYLEYKLDCKRNCASAFERIGNEKESFAYVREAMCIGEILLTLSDDALFEEYLKEANNNALFEEYVKSQQ